MKQPKEEQQINWYGLRRLGFNVPLSGDYIRDQAAIEAICHRISHDPLEGGVGRFGHFKNWVDLIYNHPDRRSLKKFIWHEWADKEIDAFCNYQEVGLAGSASSGKSNPAALWAVAQYMIDPTHVKVFCFSTTLKEAKDRLWKEVVEFWNAVPGAPGRHVPSHNHILGLNYDGNGYGNSSGIYLYAADKSNETNAVNSLIGSKVPKTGDPVEQAQRLLEKPEYKDLVKLGFTPEFTADLVLRMQELSTDRRGRIIIIIDEATGVSEKLLESYFSNLKIGNEGRVQMIVIGNPSSHFDTHGIFCEPEDGWTSISVASESWTTRTGGICLHLDGEKSPRIVNKDERLIWMPSEAGIADTEKTYGRESYYYYRMVRGFWAPSGVTDSVYCEADFTETMAMDPAPPWGFQKPVKLASLDPSFTNGGDRAVAYFADLGVDPSGRQLLAYTEEVTITADISNTKVPVPKQLALRWKYECEKRGVPPENASFDESGGGLSFGVIMREVWSRRVRGVKSGGKASDKPIPGEKDATGKPVRYCDKMANQATAIWCGMMPFLRSGQIRGLGRNLVKEICSRQKAPKKALSNITKIQIEPKEIYKAREKQSPDAADAAFILLDEAIARHGFRAADVASPQARRSSGEPGEKPKTAWEEFKDRARRITRRNSLK